MLKQKNEKRNDLNQVNILFLTEISEITIRYI